LPQKHCVEKGRITANKENAEVLAPERGEANNLVDAVKTI
jgi:hypothetical protein